jgi:hypothetical protein
MPARENGVLSQKLDMERVARDIMCLVAAHRRPETMSPVGPVQIIRGNRNVHADLGFDDPNFELAKVQLAMRLSISESGSEIPADDPPCRIIRTTRPIAKHCF